MNKSLKLKNNYYVDSKGIVHNRTLLSTIIDEIKYKLATSLPDWILKNSNLNKTLVINGDANTYYPVRITVQSNKEMPQNISIYKNLGSQTNSSYSRKS